MEDNNNILLYKDKDQQIEIDNKILNSLVLTKLDADPTKIHQIKFSNLQIGEIIRDSLETLNLPKKVYNHKVLSTGTAPLIKTTQAFALFTLFKQGIKLKKYFSYPYENLSEAWILINIAYASWNFDIDDNWKLRLESLVENYYKLQRRQNCYLRFFENSLAHGSLYLLEADKLIVLPFLFEKIKP